MKTQQKIEESKVYSAREAIKFLPGLFKSETQFRDYLRADMTGNNVFNAKVYTTSKLSRFVIRGTDLMRAADLLSKQGV